MNEFIDASALGGMIGRSRRWVYAEQERLKIPRYRFGREYRYRLSDIEVWIEQQAEHRV